MAAAERRHHLVVRADVGRAGLSAWQWKARVDQGLWCEVAPGVWRHRMTPLDWRLRARAAQLSLGPESMVFGRTAVAWWGLWETDPDEVELVVARSRRHLDPPFVLHTSTRWTACRTVRRDGLRVPTLTVAIFQLAAGVGNRTVSIRQLEAVIDEGIRRRLRPACQVVHRRDGQTVARVDFQFAGTEVVVEVSGRLGHVTDRDRQRDARRRNALQLEGFDVLEFTTADVLADPAYVLATLRTHLPTAR